MTVAPVGCGARIAHLDSGRVFPLTYRVFPLTYNVHEVVEGYATLRKLATSRDHVVPATIRSCSRPIRRQSRDWRGWVARLEVEPKV